MEYKYYDYLTSVNYLVYKHLVFIVHLFFLIKDFLFWGLFEENMRNFASFEEISQEDTYLFVLPFLWYFCLHVERISDIELKYVHTSPSDSQNAKVQLSLFPFMELSSQGPPSLYLSNLPKQLQKIKHLFYQEVKEQPVRILLPCLNQNHVLYSRHAAIISFIIY